MTVVALLRGINVGKHRRVAMSDLREVLVQAGYPGVTTHLQTGNIVIPGPRGGAAALERALEQVLRDGLGLEIDVMVRSSGRLAAIVKDNPLLRPGVDTATLYVAFLKSKPAAGAVGALAGVDFGREEFALQGTELYLRYPDGYGRSKMTGAFFERKLATPATVRNWNVTTKLAELAG